MRHYTEEQIGLFALGKAYDEGERNEFDHHLKECCTCMELYEDMSQFYEMAIDAKPLLESAEETPEKPALYIKPVITRKHRGEITHYSYFIPAKIIRFVLDRPLFVSASAFGMIALFAFVLNFKTVFKDNYLSYIKMNDKLFEIEAYNKNNEKLWGKQWNAVGSLLGAEEESLQIKITLMNDLDMDGKNEVITTIPLFEEKKQKNNILQVLDFKGDIKYRKFYNVDSISFRGVNYITNNSTDGILVDEFSEKGKKEILLNIPTNYSPSAIFRLDNEGNILGEYWHYGGYHLTNSYMLDNENKKLVIICGFENVTQRGFIAALDPSKITGKTESSQTRGFGYLVSNAEVFYIALPNPKEMLKSEVMSWVFSNQIINQENIFQFKWQMNREAASRPPVFYYSFSKDMKIIDIKLGSQTELYYHGLVEKGRIKIYSEEKLIEDLKKEILYWDGKEYRKEWSRVNVY